MTWNTYGDLSSVRNLMTQVIARDVATGVEMARSLGNKMPAEFDVGVRFLSEPDGRTRIRIRLDDATYDSLVTLPRLDTPMQRIEDVLKRAWQRLHADATTVAHIWLDRHPEARSSSVDAKATLAILDKLLSNEVLEAKWLRDCHECAKTFRYTTVA